MLTLLTTTGERLECFGLLKQFMQAQDYQGKVRWVIVDDGKKPVDTAFKKNGWTVEVLRPKPHWQPGQNTQHRNLAVGLSVIPDNAAVVVIEDDDFYGSKHLSVIKSHLDNGFNLVGDKWPRYFNCFTGCGARLKSGMHTSLAATAVKGDGLELFRECVKRGLKYVDIDLWRKYRGNRKLYTGDNCIGIKGMPGRGGIGSGHKIDFGNIVDPQEFLGDAYKFYKPFIKEFTGAHMKVRALKAHGYGGHMRKPGDEFFMKDPAHRKIMATLGNIEVLEPPKKKPGRPPKKKKTEPVVDKPVETVDSEPEAPEVKEEKQTYKTRMLKADNEE